MTDTAILGITLIDPLQSQKEVTANEAFARLEQGARKGFVVIDKDLTTPPGGESEGDAYIFLSGTWDGNGTADDITIYFNGGYIYVTPTEGVEAEVLDEGVTYKYTSGAWAVKTFSTAINLADDVQLQFGDSQDYEFHYDLAATRFELNNLTGLIMSIEDGTVQVDFAGDVSFGNDLKLPSGGVINFNSGDMTITHSAAYLTIDGGDVEIQDTTADANVILALINDVQEWRIINGGTSSDAFIIRNVTGTVNPFVIETTAPNAQVNLSSSGVVIADDLTVSAGDVDISGQTHITNGGTFADPALILDKASSSANRFRFFVGDGTGGTTADEAYIAGNNTGIHFWNGASGVTAALDIDNSQNVSIPNGFLNLGTATELTISGGVITATKSYHSVDTESDAGTDDLDTINGGTDGDIIYLAAASSARTVVIKHGTGNIYCDGAGDISLTHIADVAIGIYIGSTWRFVLLNGGA